MSACNGVKGKVMKKFVEFSLYSLICTLTFYIFMHTKGFPFWAYLAMFLILLAAGYFWNRVLPRDKDRRRSTALTIATIAAVVLLIIAAIIVTV